MKPEPRHELAGCLSLLLCGVVVCMCVVWLFFSNFWPQALAGILLAVAILLKD